MAGKPPALSTWSPEEVVLGRRWVETWKRAGARLESLKREELRNLDGPRALALLCGPANYTVPPRTPRKTSGLVEQQRWFMKAAGRD